jgi:transcriptional regulator with XRE-family HTH domain
MGYAGKVREQERARELRAQAWTLQDIAAELGVSKSSVSLWVRDVEFTPNPRRRTRPPRPSSLHLRKVAEVARCDRAGIDQVGQLTVRELLIVGVALYLGEGFKRDGQVGMANTNPQVLRLFVTWLRRCFEIDESRLRVRLYLHEGLDLRAAEQFWSKLLDIPPSQFRQAYRAAADRTLRRTKHVNGCPAITYCDSALHRRVMGLARALSSNNALPG